LETLSLKADRLALPKDFLPFLLVLEYEIYPSSSLITREIFPPLLTRIDFTCFSDLLGFSFKISIIRLLRGSCGLGEFPALDCLLKNRMFISSLIDKLNFFIDLTLPLKNVPLNYR
jgi:hypothetical protein